MDNRYLLDFLGGGVPEVGGSITTDSEQHALDPVGVPKSA
jgi:hypothetical protein